MKIYFSDFFKIEESSLEEYGAFNISLINDLPLFIDPFLLFASKKPEYQQLHKEILEYMTFLKTKAEEGINSNGQLKLWYYFPEVKQNWLGYSEIGNGGSGLGEKFAIALSTSIETVFDDLGKERVTQTSHLEKAALVEIGVGKDNISDFSTNLIKQYLLNYTQTFAEKYLSEESCRKVTVEKAYFDYDLERWMSQEFRLPYIFDDHVLLTPRDILTKDENWINAKELRGDFIGICNALPNEDLKAAIFNYFKKKLPAKNAGERHTQKEMAPAVIETIKAYPDILKYYVKNKEQSKEGAKSLSKEKVDEVISVFIRNVQELVDLVQANTEFYNSPAIGSYEESRNRIIYLKQVIENNDGHLLFYFNGQPIKREKDLQLIYKLTWYASEYDVNSEVNNGRGPVDYKISKGSADKTLVEFKLASNSKLKQNLENQVAVYEDANATKSSLKVILYFDDSELKKVIKILNDLDLAGSPDIILIDAGKKISASNVKSVKG